MEQSCRIERQNQTHRGRAGKPVKENRSLPALFHFILKLWMPRKSAGFRGIMVCDVELVVSEVQKWYNQTDKPVTEGN